jgi:hypothetical protein
VGSTKVAKEEIDKFINEEWDSEISKSLSGEK